MSRPRWPAAAEQPHSAAATSKPAPSDVSCGSSQRLIAPTITSIAVIDSELPHEKSRPKAAFKFLHSQAGTGPAGESEAVANAEVEAGASSRWRRPTAPFRATAAPPSLLHASVRGVHGGALGQVVHVAEGALLDFRGASAAEVELVRASRTGGFRQRRPGSGHRSASPCRQPPMAVAPSTLVWRSDPSAWRRRSPTGHRCSRSRSRQRRQLRLGQYATATLNGPAA